MTREPPDDVARLNREVADLSDRMRRVETLLSVSDGVCETRGVPAPRRRRYAVSLDGALESFAKSWAADRERSGRTD